MESVPGSQFPSFVFLCRKLLSCLKMQFEFLTANVECGNDSPFIGHFENIIISLSAGLFYFILFHTLWAIINKNIFFLIF